MDKKGTFLEFDRRQFVTRVIPACAVTCLGLGFGDAFALVQANKKSTPSQDKHKFDEEFERKFTYRQFFNAQYNEVIQLAKALKEEMGKDKAIEFIKKSTTKRLLKLGQDHAKRSPDNSFHTYMDTFRNIERYKNTLTMEVVEDTEKAFELKVTECIWASTFLKTDAGDIGYAYVCYGDYAWAEGFNPKIKLIRDKTLMQGHDYCNHRYILTG